MKHPYLEHYVIKPNDTILDLGATQGDFLMDILPVVKRTNSRVFCVEPELYNVARLSDYIFNNALEHAAVISGMSSVFTSTGRLIVTDQAVLHHGVMVEKQKWDYKTKGCAIAPSYALTTLIQLCGGVIDFVKCDIEGGEIETFVDARGVDWGCIKNLAIASYHVVNGERTWKKLVPFFERQGYTVVCNQYPESDNQDMVYAWRK